MPIIRIILTWLLFIPIPIINGFLRDKWYKILVGEFGANIIGFFVLSICFLIYVYAFFGRRLLDFSSAQLLLTGGIWLALTLIFEFSIGLAGGRSWSYMLADYNILKGRLWPLVLIIIFFSPLIIRKLLNFIK